MGDLKRWLKPDHIRLHAGEMSAQEMRTVLVVLVPVIAEHTAALAALDSEVERLRKALDALYVTCPTTMECQHFHHSKRERHTATEECGPAADYVAALREAAAALSPTSAPTEAT